MLQAKASDSGDPRDTAWGKGERGHYKLKVASEAPPDKHITITKWHGVLQAIRVPFHLSMDTLLAVCFCCLVGEFAKREYEV